MKLKVLFGFMHTKEVNWYQPVDQFPNIIKFLGSNFEWVFYDTDPTNNFDMILTFAEIPTYDPNYNVYCPIWTDLFPDSVYGCECGASYTSFPFDHLKMCKKWKPWNQV